MEYANHTARTITTRQAAEQAARHIVGVIRTVGLERSMWILADTLPHWTAESYTKAADPNQHANLIKHLEERITITYPRTQP